MKREPLKYSPSGFFERGRAPRVITVKCAKCGREFITHEFDHNRNCKACREEG